MSDMQKLPWHNVLFDDLECSELWSADQQLQFVLKFELAYTNALRDVGLISNKDAHAAVENLDNFQPNWDQLRAGIHRDGVIIPELIKQLEVGLDEPNAIHSGATSQDAIDTALALTVQRNIEIIGQRVAVILTLLDKLSTEFGEASMMARTRMQSALPIKAGDRISNWKSPLVEVSERIVSLRDQACRIQLGGPVGDGSSWGENFHQVAEKIATELGLRNSECWHTSRIGIVEFGHTMSLITGSLGKIGQDIALMSQQGIDEISLSGAGASSAMPHKQNPILAELLITLARYNAGQVSILHNALVHEQERSGSAWMLEWMVLPQMSAATGAAMNAAFKLIGSVTRIGKL